MEATFSIISIREILETKTKGPLSCCIKEIFQLIILNGGISAKKEALLKLIKVMESRNKQTKFHSQQDLFHILLLILNELSKQNPFFDYLFKIQCLLMCNCRIFNIQACFLENTQVCAECKTTINISLVNQSELLLVKFDQNQSQKFPLYNQYLGEKVSAVYKCIGKVFYQGNKLFGHYTASRICMDNREFLQFSDMNVYEERSFKPRFALYEKVTENGNYPSQKSRLLPSIKMSEKLQHKYGQLGRVFKQCKQSLKAGLSQIMKSPQMQ